MATITVTGLNITNISLASFTSWGEAISNALSTFGWTKVYSNVTWGTTAVPAAAAYVYETWAMADSLASTAPVYITIYYGTIEAGTISTCPWLRVQAGTTLTNNLAVGGSIMTLFNSYMMYEASIAAPQSLGAMYFSGATDRFQMAITPFQQPPGNITPPVVYSIERSNTAGADTSTSFTVLCTGYEYYAITTTTPGLYYGPTQQTINITAPAATPTSESGWIVPMSSTPCVFNGIPTIYPVIPFDTTLGTLGNPLLGVFVYQWGALASTFPVSVTISGATHTYLPLGQCQNAYNVSRRYSAITTGAVVQIQGSATLSLGMTTGNDAIAMRWE